MGASIKMYNPKTDKTKDGFIGFNWKVLFFAWIPMFVHGDIKGGISLLLTQLIFFVIQVDGASSFYWWLIFIQIIVSIVYNTRYTKKLIKQGFRFNDTDELNKAGADAVGLPVEDCVLQPSEAKSAPATGTSENLQTHDSETIDQTKQDTCVFEKEHIAQISEAISDDVKVVSATDSSVKDSNIDKEETKQKKKIFFYFRMSDKKKKSVAVMTVLLVFLIVLPIRIGIGANAHIPLIGAIEDVTQSYCDNTLERATKTYVIAKGVDRIISLIEDTKISFGFFLDVNIGIGKLLAAANDAIERICAALFTVIGIVLAEKLILGMLSWACFKILLPIALICGILHCVAPRFVPWGRSVALFLARTVILCWMFLPITTLISSYVENAYFEYEHTEKIEEGDFIDVIKNLGIDDIKEKIYEIMEYCENKTEQLFQKFCIFILTTIVIPLGSFFCIL